MGIYKGKFRGMLRDVYGRILRGMFGGMFGVQGLGAYLGVYNNWF